MVSSIEKEEANWDGFVSRVDRDELRKFLETRIGHALSHLLRHIKIDGFRYDSAQGIKRRIARLVEDLYSEGKRSTAPFKLYEKVWQSILDDATKHSWLTPTPLALAESSIDDLIGRIQSSSANLPREDLETALSFAPFPLSEAWQSKLAPLKVKAELALSTTMVDLRARIHGIEDRVASIKDGLSRAATSHDLKATRHDLEESLNRYAEEAGELSERIARDVELLKATVSGLNPVKNQNIEIERRIREIELRQANVAADLRKEFEDLLAASASREPQVSADAAGPVDAPIPARKPDRIGVFEFLPSVRIVNVGRRGAAPATRLESLGRLSSNFYDLGLGRQSSEDAALCVTAALSGCGWLTIGGSFARYVSGAVASSISGRIARVDVPFGCLGEAEEFHVTDDEPTLWLLQGADRAPLQVCAALLRSRAIAKMVSRVGDNLTVAVYEGGEAQADNAIGEASELGPYLDTDSLTWTFKVRNSPKSGILDITAFTVPPSLERSEDAEGLHGRDLCLSKLSVLTYLSYAAALKELVTDESKLATIMERTYLAPRAAALNNDSREDAIDSLADETSREIARRLSKRP